MSNLSKLIEIYSTATRRSTSVVGRMCGGSNDVYARACNGRITVRRETRVIGCLSDNWPGDVPWPDSIPRPEPAVDSISANAWPVTRYRRNAKGIVEDPRGMMIDLFSVDGIDCKLRIDAALRIYYTVIDTFSDSSAKPLRQPRQGSQSRIIHEALIQSGDVRFSQFINVQTQVDAALVGLRTDA